MKYYNYFKLGAVMAVVFFLLSLSSSTDGLEVNSVKAQGGVPHQFGGIVTYYQPACTVTNVSGTCEGVCPMCTSRLGQACTGYQEIQFSPVKGSIPPNFVCVPKGFTYKQSVPTVGGQIMGGGASSVAPWMVAASQ